MSLMADISRTPYSYYCRTDIFLSMSSKYGTLVRWFIAILFFLGFAWTMNLSLFHWWASGGPPVQHPELWRMWGSIFFGISVVLLLAFVIPLRSLIPLRRKRQ